MTAQAELTLLETTYSAWLAAGCPQSYSIAGRAIQRASAEWFTKRIDELRRQVAREANGMFYAGVFRKPE